MTTQPTIAAARPPRQLAPTATGHRHIGPNPRAQQPIGILDTLQTLTTRQDHVRRNIEASFTKRSDGSYIADEGFEDMTLVRAADGNSFELRLLSGMIVTFILEGDRYLAVSVSQPESANRTSYAHEAAAPHRILRVVAPSTSAQDCLAAVMTDANRVNESLASCRMLDFTYGSVETAAGTVSRLTEATFTAWDSAQDKLVTDAVAHYGYDGAGRLAAAWDPRMMPLMKTVYPYNDAGDLNTLQPPGQSPWLLGYDSVQGGRLTQIVQ